MIDLRPALTDPELGFTGFLVEKITYTRSRTGTSSVKSTIGASGCVHPGTPEQLQLLPEEEQGKEFIVIYTDYPLSIGTPESAGASSFTGPDRIVYDDATWRVVRVRDWGQFGYYQGYAVRYQEDAVS